MRSKPIGSTRRERNGYIVVKVSECPRLWLYEHRVVWEKANGPIPPGGIIHHKNERRSDNRLENLELCLSVSDHIVNHHPSTPEWRANIAAAGRGRTHSDETKTQMSESAKELWQSQERRARQSKALRERRALPQDVQERIKTLRSHGLSFESIAEHVFGKRSAGPRVRFFLIGGRSRY